MSVQIFISHSKGMSTDFGEKLYDWLCDAPLDFTPWASFKADDLGQGQGDQDLIRDSAKRSDLCVCILEPNNISSHWINFEAGLFYGKVGSNKKQVFTMLIGGLKYTDLTKNGSHPLSQIYHCLPNDEKSLSNFLVTIYKNHYSKDPLDSIPAKKLDAINRFISSNTTKKLMKGIP